jgi:hypothetical protein
MCRSSRPRSVHVVLPAQMFVVAVVEYLNEARTGWSDGGV